MLVTNLTKNHIVSRPILILLLLYSTIKEHRTKKCISRVQKEQKKWLTKDKIII